MDFLIIDQNKTFRDSTRFVIENEGHYAEGAETGLDGLRRLKEDRFEALLLDSSLGTDQGLDVLGEVQKKRPSLPVLMLSDRGNVKSAVEAMRRGAIDFLEKPFLREHFLVSLARLQSYHRSVRNVAPPDPAEKNGAAKAPAPRLAEPLFDFGTPLMKQVMARLLRAAASPVSILIFGESGTGKTVAARAAHQHSDRRDKPFVTVSCPSLSRELLESELFGHVKGSFTGAVHDRWGKVKAAEGGTLFFDEIGDLPMEIQSKLLRLLQEREYERVGENLTRTADARVIAATNCNLKRRIAAGTFREDLYFRLNVIPVELPPLRARSEDLVRFAEHYLQSFAARCGRPMRGFSDDAKSCLSNHSWPGNLRELRNAVEHGVIMANQDTLTRVDLPDEIQPCGGVADSAPDGAFNAGARISLGQLADMHIRRVLKETPVMSKAAKLLGIDQATLYRKRKEMGLLDCV